ncbi:MAG: DUF4381 domain-containing protein [Chromatiales bacterium]
MNTPAESLAQLRDIHLPTTPGWWPPAPGWWLVTLVSLILLLLLLRSLWRLYHRWHWRRRVLRHFRQLSNHGAQLDNIEYVTAITRLLRQLAITCYPQSQVASLSGQQWLKFLEQQSHGLVFTQGIAQLLVELPYRQSSTPLTDRDRQQLLQLAQSWAKQQLRRPRQTQRKQAHAV